MRVHVSFVVLLALAAGYSVVTTGSMERGIGLWLALCAAVLVREIARAIAAAYTGLPLRALFLLPVGGVMALAPRREGLTPAKTRIITATGSAANFGVALLLLGFAYGVDPHVALVQQPWITIEHILRSAVWLQVVLGIVNLLPTGALPSAKLLRTKTPERTGEATPPARPARTAPGLVTAAATVLMLSGIFFLMLWPFLLGLTVLLLAFVNRSAGAGSAEAMSITVRDVMLTEYKPLSANNTLRDSLRQTTHTAQELFPVLRGERLVGWVSRTALAARLQAEGDGFLQGTMSRSLQTASPAEKLGDALRRAAAGGATEFIPVIEDGAMLGMLTPGVLERAVNQLRLTQPPVTREDA